MSDAPVGCFRSFLFLTILDSNIDPNTVQPTRSLDFLSAHLATGCPQLHAHTDDKRLVIKSHIKRRLRLFYLASQSTSEPFSAMNWAKKEEYDYTMVRKQTP